MLLPPSSVLDLCRRPERERDKYDESTGQSTGNSPDGRREHRTMIVQYSFPAKESNPEEGGKYESHNDQRSFPFPNRALGKCEIERGECADDQ